MAVRGYGIAEWHPELMDTFECDKENNNELEKVLQGALGFRGRDYSFRAIAFTVTQTSGTITDAMVKQSLLELGHVVLYSEVICLCDEK